MEAESYRNTQRFEVIEGHLSHLTDAVGDLSQGQRELRLDVTELRDQMVGLNGRVTGLERQVTQLDGKVTQLDGKVTQLDSKFDVMSVQVTAIAQHLGLVTPPAKARD